MKNAVMVALAAALLMPLAAGLSSAPVQAQGAFSSRGKSTSITVIIIRDYIGPDDFQQVPRTYRYSSEQTYARGQEEIRNNPDIRAILQRRGIPARNVSGVQTAWNGGKIVYVR